MTTYKLITEQELQQAIDALMQIDVRWLEPTPCPWGVINDILRAVQEREGPKLEAWVHYKDKFGCNVYCDPEDVAEIDHDRYQPVPLYTLPEEPK